MEGFYSREELDRMGFLHVGENVLLSKKSSFYGTGAMSFGDNVRVDDFCLFVGNIKLGSYIHVAAYCGLHASMGSITMADYTTFSSNCTVYAASDDYSGAYMTNAIVPKEYKNDIISDIYIGPHSIIGAGSTLLPGAAIPEGVAVGAMSLVRSALEPWSINVGIPARKVRDREKGLLTHFEQFQKDCL